MLRARRAVVAAALFVCAALSGCSSDPGEPAGRRAPAASGTVVWAIGDGGTGGNRPKQIAQLVARDRPTRVLYLGDVYDSGTAREFQRNFHDVYRALVRRMLPTPGNHEWGKRAEGYFPYWERVRGRPLPQWYETRIAGWHVLSLNTEAPHGERSPQLRWLRSRLGGRSTCRIAFWHRPRFSAGKHGDQEDVAPLWNAVRGRVALVLSGHDHSLQRLEPIDGTVTVVSGAAGRPRHSVDDDDPRLAFGDDDHFGGVRLELHRRRALLTFIAADGTMLDRSTVACRR